MTAHSVSAGGEREGKRARILAAAERVFAQRGFFAARVSEIAKDAGVADGTIYLYFKSKDDLLISLFESRMEQVNRTLDATIAEIPTSRPVERLRAFLRTYLQLVHDEPAAAEVLTIELRQSSKFMKEYDNPRFADFLRVLGGLIADGQRTGEFDATVPSHVAARMIFGMLDELALAWVLARRPPETSTDSSTRSAISAAPPGTRPKKFDIVRAADWVVTFVCKGLARSPGNLKPSKESP